MKNTLLTLALVATGFTCQAQAVKDTVAPVNHVDKKHELKLGALKLLAGGIVEVTYEHIQSRDFGYGISVLGNFDGSNNEFPEDFSVTPFARFYFQEKRDYGAKGFFVEGFGKFIVGHNYTYYSETFYNNNSNFYQDYTIKKSFTAGAAGISLGWKWINHSGFVFEILAGGGRVLGGNNNAPNGIFRGDFNIGYRF